ncbi:MAG: hypothetical protein U5O16_21240 [Rhodococcus sp. (in: high G+C Gram-positive bacteria)]|nr:hypothetical protein [Rhodococcus sp. (in: high G+C Gram-positive bacteria)]
MDRVFRQITGSEYAAGTPLPCEAASTTSEPGSTPQVTYLDSLIGPHRNA